MCNFFESTDTRTEFSALFSERKHAHRKTSEREGKFNLTDSLGASLFIVCSYADTDST